MVNATTLMTASKQWATRPADERYETLSSLREAVAGRRLRSRSTDVALNKVHVEVVDGSIAINSVIAPSEPSHWALTQFCGNLKVPAGYLRELPAPLLATNLNHALATAPRDQVKFMSVETVDGGMNTLQAVTSPTYGRIWDADCVDAVGRIVERSNGRFHNPLAYATGETTNRLGGCSVPSGLYASDRDVFMFMIDGGSDLEVGPRAQLNRGFFVSNSEVGAGSFEVTTFLFNRCCGNHIIWGAKDVNTLKIRHTSGGPRRFETHALPALMGYVQSSAEAETNAVKAAMAFAIPLKGEDLAEFLRPFKFTKTEIQSAVAFAKSEEGKCSSLWDLIQGFTAYARGFDFVDARTDLETRAGKLLAVVTE